jgi:hypothetical protein
MSNKLLRVIDIERSFSTTTQFIMGDRVKIKHLDDFTDTLVPIFHTLAEYTYINKSFQISTKIVPASKLTNDKKHEYVKEFLDTTEINESDSLRIYDLFDFYIATMTDIIIKLQEGFAIWKENANLPITFNETFEGKLHILFYILFRDTFTTELRRKLQTVLKITNVENRMLDACQDKLISNYNKICKYKQLDPSKIKGSTGLDKIKNLIDIKEYPLDTQYGVLLLLTMMNDIRAESKSVNF